jgi:hypothetical protein
VGDLNLQGDPLSGVQRAPGEFARERDARTTGFVQGDNLRLPDKTRELLAEFAGREKCFG